MKKQLDYNLDIDQLHEAFNNPNAIGQTTLMFDSIEQSINLIKEEKYKNLSYTFFVFGANISHCEKLAHDLDIYLKVRFGFGLFKNSLTKNRLDYIFSCIHFNVDFKFRPYMFYENYRQTLRGIHGATIFIDHYCYEYEITHVKKFKDNWTKELKKTNESNYSIKRTSLYRS